MADSGKPADIGTLLIGIAMVGGIIYTILPKGATPPPAEIPTQQAAVETSTPQEVATTTETTTASQDSNQY